MTQNVVWRKRVEIINIRRCPEKVSRGPPDSNMAGVATIYLPFADTVQG